MKNVIPSLETRLLWQLDVTLSQPLAPPESSYTRNKINIFIIYKYKFPGSKEKDCKHVLVIHF